MDAATAAPHEIPAGGLFSPEDVTWRVNRELILLAGGGRGMLLQLADPDCAGPKDPWKRLSATLSAASKVVFGKPDAARKAVPRLTALGGEDPDRMLWVWATLVDTAVCVYDRFVEPLGDEERERYYAEQQRLAKVTGVRDTAVPAGWDAFQDYVGTTVEDRLKATRTARRAWDVLQRPPKVPWPLLPMFWPTALVTTALLPAPMRERLELTYNAAMQRTFDASAEVASRLLPLLPSVAREFPEARSARQQVKT